MTVGNDLECSLRLNISNITDAVGKVHLCSEVKAPKDDEGCHFGQFLGSITPEQYSEKLTNKRTLCHVLYWTE